MMIGVRAHDLGEFSLSRLEEFIQEIKKYKFSHIQLVLWKSFIDIDPYLKNISLKDLEDKFGNLNLEYTYDGLHFNDKGYSKLVEILEKEIEL